MKTTNLLSRRLVRQHLKSLIAVLALGAALGQSAKAQIVFNSSDVVNNQIQYNYNTDGDQSFINGVSTGLGFADTASNPSGLIVDPGTTGSYFLYVDQYPATALSSDSFVYNFVLPTGDTISGLSLAYRLTEFDSVQAGDNVTLSISTNGTTYTPFATLTADGLTTQDTGTSLDLTAAVAGASQYYIMGTYTFGAADEQAPYGSEIFRADSTGAAAATFVNNITVTSTVPEPSTYALLASSVLGLLVLLRKRASSKV
jgi:hypothetical protein